MNFQNFQYSEWNDLFTRTIYDVFASKNFSYKGVNVTFEPKNASAFLKVPIIVSGTNSKVLKADITITNGDSVCITKDIIDLPLYSMDGIMIKNTRWSYTNVSNCAGGWYLRQQKNGTALTLNRGALAVLTFRQNSKGDTIVSIRKARVAKGESNKTDITLPVFLKAISCDPSITFEDIQTILSDCPYLLCGFVKYDVASKKKSNKYVEPSTAEAADIVLHAITGVSADYSWSDPIAELRKRLKNNALRIGAERIPRFKKFTSFARALQEGVTLAEDITVGKIRLHRGDAITPAQVAILDNDPTITSICVTKGDTAFRLDRYVATEALTFEEFICALRVYDQFLGGLGQPDDPDEQYNKIIGSIKNEYEDYISGALDRFVAYITKVISTCTSGNIIDKILEQDFKDIMTPRSYITDLINKKSCYQQFDDTNSLSLFDQAYKITSTAKEVSDSARDIHAMQYGRICAYTTPESKQVGLNLSIGIMTGIDRYGFLTTAVLRFTEGKLATEPEYISALDELYTVIAPADADLEAMWAEHSDEPAFTVDNCRINGEIKAAYLRDITHRAVSNAQILGPLMAAVPSVNRNAGKRLIMAAGAQRQALPPWNKERPYVTTALESLMDIGVVTASSLMSDHLASVGVHTPLAENTPLYYLSAKPLGTELQVEFFFTHEDKNYTITRVLRHCTSTVKGAFKYQRLACPPESNHDSTGRYYTGNDVVFYNNDVDISTTDFNTDTINYGHYKLNTDVIQNRGVAIGSNVNVMFKSFEGFTYEDSIVVNEDYLARQGLTIIKTTTLQYVLKANTQVAMNPNSQSSYPQLDCNGYPIPGFYVQTGQAILSLMKEGADGKVKYCYENLTIGQSGFIISHTEVQDGSDKIIRISLGEILPLAIGDKLEGLHGNKGVIGRICRPDEMPYTEDGIVPDFIFNSLGILARLNLGQIFEGALGAISKKTGKVQILEPFAAQSIEETAALAEEYGIVEKDAYDGRTGLRFDKKAMIGNMYVLRLEHTNTSKFNASSNCNDNINTRTMQPARGPGGGQRMSELCTWCIMSYDATTALDTLFTVQSDAISSKQSMDKAIQHREIASIPYSSNNIGMIQAYFNMLGANVAVNSAEGDSTRIELLTQKFMDRIAPRKCDIKKLCASTTPQDLLHDVNIYGDAKKAASDMTTLVQLPFGCNMIMPIFLHQNQVTNLCSYTTLYKGAVARSISRFSTDAIKNLIAGKTYLVGWDPRETDPELKAFMLKEYKIELPDTYEIPIIDKAPTQAEYKANRDSYSNYTENSHGIRAVVALFSRFKVLYGLCQPLSGGPLAEAIKCPAESFKGIENIVLFSQCYELSDFIVTSMLIPPTGYRPISESDSKMSSPIDTKLNAVVGPIKYLLLNHGNDDSKARIETNLFNTLYDITFKADNRNPCLVDQLTDHDHKIAILRDVLLAKRMSYTGRSVISIAPNLQLGECGVPISMLSVIFEEHIAAELSDSSKNHIISILCQVANPNSKTLFKSFFKKAVKYLSNNNIKGFRILCMSNYPQSMSSLLESVSDQYNTRVTDANISIPTIQSLFDLCYRELHSILVELLKTHPVDLNREPSLHKFSIQGFDAVPVDAYTIMLQPLNCHGFNGDFDGDQMAAIVPMHEAAIRDTRAKMMSADNLLDPKDGKGIVLLNQDMILGLYYASIHAKNELKYKPTGIKAVYDLATYSGFGSEPGKSYGIAEPIASDIFAGLLHVHDTIICRVDGRAYIAEAGKILINAILPGNLGFTGVKSDDVICGYTNHYKLKVDYVLYKKSIKNVEAICIDYFDSFGLGKDTYGDSLAAAYNRLMVLGFKFADLSGITLSLHDFARLPIKSMIDEALKQTAADSLANDEWYNMGFCTEENHSQNQIDMWTVTTKALKEYIKEEFSSGTTFDRFSNIFMIIDSGARGDVHQLLEMSGIIGIVTNSLGKQIETPILSSYMDGLSPSYLFLNAYTSRRQTAAAQLTTAKAGEFNRECIYLNEHIHIRGNNDHCDGESLWLDIDYQPVMSIKAKKLKGCRLILPGEEFDGLDESLFENHEWYLFNSNTMRKAYVSFCDAISPLLKSDMLYDEFGNAQTLEDLQHFLTIYKQPFFFVAYADGTYARVDIEFKMSDASRKMLFFRVMDLNAMENDPELKGYASTFMSNAAPIAGDIPDSVYVPTMKEWNKSEYPDIVIGNKTLKAIENAVITRVPIFTIIGCTSDNGVCKRCFGVKYDSRRFPNSNEHIGYQGVQAIGNPITQLILDSHKDEYRGEKSPKDKLDDILKSSSYTSDPLEELRGQATSKEIESEMSNYTFSMNPSSTVHITRDDNGYTINLVGEYTQTLRTSRLANIKVKDGDVIPAGTAVLPVDTSKYGNWLSYAKTTTVQKGVWEMLCGCFVSDDILSRNFEIFARSLTEFGIAKESMPSQGIVKGCTYLTTKLQKLGIDYDAAFLSDASAISRSGKAISGIAWKYLAEHLCDALVRCVEDNSSSNISKYLVGDYPSASHKLYTKSVVASNCSTKAAIIETTSTIEVEAEEPTPTFTQTQDTVASQLLAALDNMEDTTTEVDTENYEDTDYVQSANDNTDSSDDIAETNFFGG